MFGIFGGGTSSKTKQTITNNVVNSNYFESLNQSIMNASVNALIKNASGCSSSVNQNNLCNMSGSTVGGDFTFNSDQSNTSKVNFSCVQENNAAADMSTAMMQELVADIKTLSGTTAATDLNAAAIASSKTGFISTGGGATKSNSKANITNEITNETSTIVKNIYEQNLNNNFTSETVSDCIGKTYQENVLDLSNINVGGEATVSCVQTNSLEQIQSCRQLNDAVSKTLQETFQELGLKVETENTTGIHSESSLIAQAESIATGPIEEIGNAIANIFGAQNLMFSIISIVCVVILGGMLYFVFGGSGSTSINIPAFNKMPKNNAYFGGFSDTSYYTI